jgi:hypothetical protein
VRGPTRINRVDLTLAFPGIATSLVKAIQGPWTIKLVAFVRCR